MARPVAGAERLEVSGKSESMMLTQLHEFVTGTTKLNKSGEL